MPHLFSILFAFFRTIIQVLFQNIHNKDVVAVIHFFRKYKTSIQTINALYKDKNQQFKLKTVSISNIFSKASINQWHGKMLYAWVNSLNPGSIVELGTNLGYGTSFLAAASKNCPIDTVDAAEDLIKIAQSNFNDLGFSNIKVHHSFFIPYLKEYKRHNKSPLFVFIDGDHHSSAINEIMTILIKFLEEDDVLVLHDIHRNKDMYAAWKKTLDSLKPSYSCEYLQIGLIVL